MVSLKLKYTLRQEEVEEALLDLDYKREGRFGTVNLWIVTILGCIILIAYIRNPGQFFLFLMLLLIISLLFYMTYGIRVGRKQRAKKITGIKGEYMLELTDAYILSGEKKERTALAGSKLLLLCSEQVFVLRTGRDVFTIPRRILSDEESGTLKGILLKHGARVVNIEIRKE